MSSLMPGLARQNAEVRLFRAFSQMGGAVLAAGSLSDLGLVWAGHLFGVLSSMLAPLILHFHITLPGARLRWNRRPVLVTANAVGLLIMLPYLAIGPVSYWWRAGWGNRGLCVALGGALALFALSANAWWGSNYGYGPWGGGPWYGGGYPYYGGYGYGGYPGYGWGGYPGYGYGGYPGYGWGGYPYRGYGYGYGYPGYGYGYPAAVAPVQPAAPATRTAK